MGLTLDWYPIQGVAVIFLVDSCYRNRVFLQHSSGWTDYLAQVQTSSLPFLISFFYTSILHENTDSTQREGLLSSSGSCA